MKLSSRNEFIATGSATWASSAANTKKVVAVTPPDNGNITGSYLVSVRNNLTSSAITVVVKDKLYAGTYATGMELTRFTLGTAGATTTPGIPGKVVPVSYWLMGSGGRIEISNDSAITTNALGAVGVRVGVKMV